MLSPERTRLLERCATRTRISQMTLACFAVWFLYGFANFRFLANFTMMIPWQIDIGVNYLLHRRVRTIALDPTADPERGRRLSTVGYVITNIAQPMSLGIGVIFMEESTAVGAALLWLVLMTYNTLAVHERSHFVVIRILFVVIAAAAAVMFRTSSDPIEFRSVPFAVISFMAAVASIQVFLTLRSSLQRVLREQAIASTVFFSIPEGVAVVDADMKPMRANQTFWDLAGPLIDGDGVVQLESAPRSFTDYVVGGRRLEISTHPVGESLPGGQTMIIRDLTEQRLSEIQTLQQSNRAAIGTLASGIAHDFNNLMTVIKGNLDVAGRDLTLSPETKRLIRTSLLAVEQGQALSTQLMGLGGDTQLETRRVKVSALLDDVVEVSGGSLGKGFTVQHRCDCDSWVDVDVGSAHAAILNLLLNARDASEAPSTIRLHAREIPAPPTHLSEARDRSWVAIEVSDDGSGMPAEAIDQATSAYFTTKADDGGHGLGLAMVAAFVQRSSGEFEITSDVGVGTTVSLRLPCAPTRHPSCEGHNGADVPLNVLVVEDDQPLAEVLANTITDLGHDVTAIRGVTGLARIATDDLAQVHVVLCDYQLQNHTAVEVQAELARRRWSGELIVVTGHDTVTGAQVLRETGVQTMLRKPLSAETLRRVLSSAAGSASYGS